MHTLSSPLSVLGKATELQRCATELQRCASNTTYHMEIHKHNMLFKHSGSIHHVVGMSQSNQKTHFQNLAHNKCVVI